MPRTSGAGRPSPSAPLSAGRSPLPENHIGPLSQAVRPRLTRAAYGEIVTGTRFISAGSVTATTFGSAVVNT